MHFDEIRSSLSPTAKVNHFRYVDPSFTFLPSVSASRLPSLLVEVSFCCVFSGPSPHPSLIYPVAALIVIITFILPLDLYHNHCLLS